MENDQLSTTGGSNNTKDKNDVEESIDDEGSSKNDIGKVTFRNTPEFRKDFINCCLEEVNDVGYMRSSLRVASWEKIGNKLSAKYKCTMTQKKLRNHWDYLKKQYTAWGALLSRKGHGYNAETNTFNWSKEQWDEIIKKVKHSSQFREKRLDDAELLKCLFESKFSTGDIRSTQSKPRTTENVNLEQPAATEDPPVPEESEQPAHHVDPKNVAIGDTQETYSTEAPVRQNKRKRGETSSNDSTDERMDYLVEVIDKHLQQKQILLEKHQTNLEKKESLATSEFMKALDNLKDAGHISYDDLVQVVLKASELTGWQKLFVNAPNVEYQVSFIKGFLGK